MNGSAPAMLDVIGVTVRFGERADRTGEAQLRKVFEKFSLEQFQRIEMLECRGVEAVLFQRLGQSLDSSRNHKAAPRRHPPHRNFKRRDIVEPVIEERRADGQLI